MARSAIGRGLEQGRHPLTRQIQTSMDKDVISDGINYILPYLLHFVIHIFHIQFCNMDFSDSKWISIHILQDFVIQIPGDREWGQTGLDVISKLHHKPGWTSIDIEIASIFGSLLKSRTKRLKRPKSIWRSGSRINHQPVADHMKMKGAWINFVLVFVTCLRFVFVSKLYLWLITK